MRQQEIDKMVASRLDRGLPRKGIIGGPGIPDRPRHTPGGRSVFFDNLTPEQQLLLSRTLMALVVLGGVGGMAHALINPSPVMADGLEAESSDKSPLTGKPILRQAGSHQKIFEKPSLTIGDGSRASVGLASGRRYSSVRSEITVASAINNKGMPVTATGKSGKEQTGGGGWIWGGINPLTPGAELKAQPMDTNLKCGWVYKSDNRDILGSYSDGLCEPNFPTVLAVSANGRVGTITNEEGGVAQRIPLTGSGPGSWAFKDINVIPSGTGCHEVSIGSPNADPATYTKLACSASPSMGVVTYKTTVGGSVWAQVSPDYGPNTQWVEIGNQPPGRMDYEYAPTTWSSETVKKYLLANLTGCALAEYKLELGANIGDLTQSEQYQFIACQTKDVMVIAGMSLVAIPFTPGVPDEAVGAITIFNKAKGIWEVSKWVVASVATVASSSIGNVTLVPTLTATNPLKISMQVTENPNVVQATIKPNPQTGKYELVRNHPNSYTGKFHNPNHNPSNPNNRDIWERIREKLAENPTARRVTCWIYYEGTQIIREAVKMKYGGKWYLAIWSGNGGLDIHSIKSTDFFYSSGLPGNVKVVPCNEVTMPAIP